MSMNNKIRKYIWIFLPIVIVIIIIISVYTHSKYERMKQNYQFIPLEHHAIFDIVYDKENKVMYTMSLNGTLTPIYNPDGTIRLYKEE